MTQKMMKKKMMFFTQRVSLCEHQKENYMQCKDCEYSTLTFHNLGRHTYKNHKAGSKEYKENVVDIQT